MSNFFGEKKIRKEQIKADDPLAVQKFCLTLQSLCTETIPNFSFPLIILCIGTDRSTGDSLGPIIGTELSKLHLAQTYVFGTLDYPVHATNLSKTIAELNTSFRQPTIIAIDACLGKLESVGSIIIGEGPIKPGAGVNKDLPPVGDLHITGVVNVGGFLENMVLQNTRLSLVMKIARVITAGLINFIPSMQTQLVPPSQFANSFTPLLQRH